MYQVSATLMSRSTVVRRTVINIQGNYNLTHMTLPLLEKLNCTDVKDQFLGK